MAQYWREVWSSTKATIGGWQAITSMVVFPVVGFAVHFWRDGAEAVEAEVYIWALYGLAPLGGVFVVIFAWNMATAPLRLERLAHAQTRSRLEANLKKAVGDMKQENAVLVGLLQQSGVKVSKAEPGENANGKYIRQPNGDQTCIGGIGTQLSRRGEEQSVTFPAAFSDVPTVNLVPDGVLRVTSLHSHGMTAVKIDDTAPQAVTYTAKGRYLIT